MSVSDPNERLEAMLASLAAKLPARRITRSLPADPFALPREQLLAGVLCIVNGGGGDFANFMGREGDLGHLEVTIAGFVQVAENTDPVEIEKAELALALDVLNWTNDPGAVHPGGAIYPLDFSQSKQLEHPYGWVVLKLDVRP